MLHAASHDRPTGLRLGPDCARALGRILSPFDDSEASAPTAGVSVLQIFHLACRHRLETELGLALQCPGGAPDAPRFPAHTMLFLEEALRRNRERDGRFRAQAADAIAALNAAGVTPTLLKGVHDAVEGPPGATGARWMADLDLLVPRKHRTQAAEALTAIGYRQPIRVHDDHYGHHLPAFHRRGEPGAIEVHWELAFGQGGQILPASEIARAAIEREASGLRYRVLPDEQRLAYIVMHAQVADRHHVRRELPLRALNDFAQLASRADAIDWQAILERFRLHGAELECGSFLTLAHRLFDWPWPFDEAPPAAWDRHARQTLYAMRLPVGITRTLSLGDELRKGFSLPVLERVYPELPDAGPWALRRHHLTALLRKHRGGYWARLAGRAPH